MRKVCIFCLSVLGAWHAFGDETKWGDFSKLDCAVVSSNGFFNSYSAPPPVGSRVEIDLKSILKERSSFQFQTKEKISGPAPYIPCSEPFKLKKKIIYPKLQYIAQRFVSGEGTSSPVTLDVSNGAHFAPGSVKAAILVESNEVVAGVCFLQCRIVQ